MNLQFGFNINEDKIVLDGNGTCAYFSSEFDLLKDSDIKLMLYKIGVDLEKIPLKLKKSASKANGIKVNAYMKQEKKDAIESLIYIIETAELEYNSSDKLCISIGSELTELAIINNKVVGFERSLNHHHQSKLYQLIEEIDDDVSCNYMRDLINLACEEITKRL